jgi:nucleoside-diphosphate-sugar epimerase
MILITGANGFIGSHLTPVVKKKFKNEGIFCLNEGEFDLVTGKNLGKIPQNPRLIIHLAAATDTSKRDQKCNDIGTKNLIKYLPKIGSNTHFIYTSTQAIFSDRGGTDKPIDEKTKPATNNEYGKTKLKAEGILFTAAKKQKFKLTIIRLPTVWGDNPRKNSFLNFLKSLVNKNSLISRLNWPGKVALINIEDIANFIVKTSLKVPQKSKIIAIAAQNLTLAEIFEKITTGKGRKYKQIRVPNFVWSFARFLRPYLKYFEFLLPLTIYNYFWRASIVVDSPLWCKVNVKGIKFTS